jgi:hypothetical protein
MPAQASLLAVERVLENPRTVENPPALGVLLPAGINPRAG